MKTFLFILPTFDQSENNGYIVHNLISIEQIHNEHAQDL